MFSHDHYEALQQGAALLDRQSRGRLLLTGVDRRTYLHGLLTNDIAALQPGTGCYAALLTPQGRMLSDMRVSELGDRVLIDLPEATAESVRRSEEHTSELQSQSNLVCRLLLEKKKNTTAMHPDDVKELAGNFAP